MKSENTKQVYIQNVPKVTLPKSQIPLTSKVLYYKHFFKKFAILFDATSAKFSYAINNGGA
jgi:hypothetical protein